MRVSSCSPPMGTEAASMCIKPVGFCAILLRLPDRHQSREYLSGEWWDTRAISLTSHQPHEPGSKAQLAQVAVVERFLRPTQLSRRNQPGASLSFFTSRLVNLLEPTAYLSNVVNCAPSSATCTASRLAGSFALAFSLTRWRLPGGSKKLSPAL